MQLDLPSTLIRHEREKSELLENAEEFENASFAL